MYLLMRVYGRLQAVAVREETQTAYRVDHTWLNIVLKNSGEIVTVCPDKSSAYAAMKRCEPIDLAFDAERAAADAAARERVESARVARDAAVKELFS